MNDDRNPKSSGRLLSKVVKFISSPTTDWADLNRVGDSEASPSASNLALKEIIERKRRNDFVRRREFDMLRKLRRRQLSGVTDPGALLSSIASSDVSADHDERERTLEKIDRIEEQMSRVWLGSDSTGAPAAAPGHTYQPTTPQTLNAPAGATLNATLSPTIFEGDPLATGHGGDGAAPLPGVAVIEPTPIPPVAAADEAPLRPELEEAAIRFANGDAAGAEASLLDLLSDGQPLCDDVQAWLTLFDLYRASGASDKFDGAAIVFVGRFGRSAPQWELLAGANSGPVPMASVNAALVAPTSMHWTAPASIGTQTVATLNAVLARHAPPWRVDWRRVKTIEPAALPALVDLLHRWAESPVSLRFVGAEELLTVLAAQSPSNQRDVEPEWWEARLALLRVMNEPDEFELVALNYCVTYEMSPPSWDDPRCEFAQMVEGGHTLSPAEGDAEPNAAASAERSAWAPAAAGASEVATLDLEGDILDDSAAAMQALELSENTLRVEFNCRQLRRVDFGAAGTLLNWAVEQQGHGRQVAFNHVNRLVAVFFTVIGIADLAQVRRRVD